MIKFTRRRDKKYLKIDLLLPFLVLFSCVITFVFVRSLFVSSSDVLSFSTISFSAFEKFLTKKVDKDNEFEKLKARLDEQGNKYSLYIEDLVTGKTYTYNPNQKIYAASVYKMPVAVTILNEIEKGNLSLTTELTYTQQDFEGGTGVLSGNRFGTLFSVEQLLTNLIDHSDNVAQNILLHRVSKAQIGALINQVNGTPSGSSFAGENIAASAEVATFIKNIYKGDTLTQENKNLLFSEMKETDFDDRISAHLKEGLSFAHKIGNWGDTNSWHDCGIVFGTQDKFVVCVMSQGTTFETFLEIGKDTAEFINVVVR